MLPVKLTKPVLQSRIPKIGESRKVGGGGGGGSENYIKHI
jgi:hypothetical protein